MGNEQKKAENHEIRQNQRFGSVIVKKKYHKRGVQNIQIFTMTLSKTLSHQKIFKFWEQSINLIHDSQTKQIILLPLQKHFQRIGMCGSSGNAQVIVEKDRQHLRIMPIHCRTKQKAEEKLKNILFNVNYARAGNKFEKFNKKVGDISPKNIVINDCGQIKVLSTCSLPEEKTNFQKAVENDNQKVFLAPQELVSENLRNGEYPSSVNACKAEVFSIGLTILSAAILRDCYQLYELPEKINELKINEYLRQIKHSYSSYFFQKICSMLIFSPVDRKKIGDIYSQLSNYEDQILELIPFYQTIQPQKK